jgi:hypothetical protein
MTRYQRTGWMVAQPNEVLLAVIPDLEVWRKEVDDGTLTLLRSKEAGWHLSISFKEKQGHAKRYPTWDEITAARYGFLPDTVHMVMHLPPKEEYVNLHETTFHLWEDTSDGQ